MNFIWIGFDKGVNIDKVCSFIKNEFNLKECNEYDWNKFDELEKILKQLKLSNIMEYYISTFY